MSNRDAVDATLVSSRALLGVVAKSVGAALEQVSLTQFRLLVLLSTRGPTRSGDLAMLSGVHPSTLSRMADRLVERGWVVRSGNPESRREVLIELSESGRVLVRDVTRARRREIAKILDRLDDEGREQVLAGMRRFALAAGEPDPQDLKILGV
ncbi:MAG: MarR family transcriptional regulator [Nocardioidaceae bacterium]